VSESAGESIGRMFVRLLSRERNCPPRVAEELEMLSRASDSPQILERGDPGDHWPDGLQFEGIEADFLGSSPDHISSGGSR
jgi:hypothetical protein